MHVPVVDDCFVPSVCGSFQPLLDFVPIWPFEQKSFCSVFISQSRGASSRLFFVSVFEKISIMLLQESSRLVDWEATNNITKKLRRTTFYDEASSANGERPSPFSNHKMLMFRCFTFSFSGLLSAASLVRHTSGS